MDYSIGTACDPCTLHMRIRSLNGGNLRLQVIDRRFANTFLADRLVVAFPRTEHDCYVPLPISPPVSYVRIFDEQEGPSGPGNSFNVLKIRKMGLQTYREAIDWLNPEIFQAIALGSRFCYNAGWLDTTGEDRAYCSPDQSLKIKYLDILINPQTNQKSVTPMRIADDTNIMEASRILCVPFTVSGRLAMYFHEFAHKFKNKNPRWELEADLNGLIIYLALGYSRYEALQVYTKVFSSVPSPENTERLSHIEQFINNFEYYIKHQ